MNLDMTQDITSLTDFQRNTAEHIAKIKKSKRPEVLTIKGTPELVVLDVDSFQCLLQKADYAETVESIRRGMRQVGNGEGMNFHDALEEIAQRYGMSLEK